MAMLNNLSQALCDYETSVMDRDWPVDQNDHDRVRAILSAMLNPTDAARDALADKVDDINYTNTGITGALFEYDEQVDDVIRAFVTAICRQPAVQND